MLPIKFTEKQKKIISQYFNMYIFCDDMDFIGELEICLCQVVYRRSGCNIKFYNYDDTYHTCLNLLVFMGEIDMKEVLEKTNYLIFFDEYVPCCREVFLELFNEIENKCS